MNGKSKCKILKDIRRKIAQDNDIAYVTSECKFQGDCSGTCPKCEAELRYLEEELAKRKRLGKTVAVAGIAAALVVGSGGCDAIIHDQTAGAPTAETEPYSTELILGQMAYEDPTESTEVELEGRAVYPTVPLMGDVPMPEDPTWQD
jgi:hypothetical protein